MAMAFLNNQFHEKGGLMNKILLLSLFFIISGCGYTTSGCLYSGRKIIIEPVVNKITITSENREYANYDTFPILIEITPDVTCFADMRRLLEPMIICYNARNV